MQQRNRQVSSRTTQDALPPGAHARPTTSVPPAVYAAGTPRWAGRDRAMADAAGCERGGPCGGPAGSRRAGTAVARVARGRG